MKKKKGKLRWILAAVLAVFVGMMALGSAQDDKAPAPTSEPVRAAVTAAPTVAPRASSTATPRPTAAATPKATAAPRQAQEKDYVLNTNTMKFHKPTCSSVEDIADKNRQDYRGTAEDLIAQGYEPCGRCHPN